MEETTRLTLVGERLVEPVAFVGNIAANPVHGPVEQDRQREPKDTGGLWSIFSGQCSDDCPGLSGYP